MTNYYQPNYAIMNKVIKDTLNTDFIENIKLLLFILILKEDNLQLKLNLSQFIFTFSEHHGENNETRVLTTCNFSQELSQSNDQLLPIKLCNHEQSN